MARQDDINEVMQRARQLAEEQAATIKIAAVNGFLSGASAATPTGLKEYDEVTASYLWDLSQVLELIKDGKANWKKFKLMADVMSKSEQANTATIGLALMILLTMEEI